MATTTTKAPVLPAGPSLAEYLEPVSRAGDRSLAWYLNLLAGTLEGPVPGHPPLTEKDAACKWAGVSTVNFSLVGALNVEADNVDRQQWLGQKAVLNQLAQGKTLEQFRVDPGVWVNDREALLLICRSAVV